MKLATLLTSLSLFAAFCASSFASSMKIETSELAPTTAAIACPLVGESDLRWYYFSDSPVSRREIGQVVTPTTTTKVRRLILSVPTHDKAVGSKAGGAAVKLQWYRYDDLSSLDKNQAIAESRGTLPQGIAPGQYLSFDFPEVSLDAGHAYAFVISFEDPLPNQFLNISSAPSRSYPDGTAVFFTTPKDQEVPQFEEFKANLVFWLMNE